MKSVLVLDIGTGGVHASLVDREGKLSVNSYEELEYRYEPDTLGYSLDAQHLFGLAKRALKASLVKAGPDGVSAVAAVAVTSQRHGCVALDKDDIPLAAYPNIDTRAEAEALEMRDRGKEIFRLTGRWPAPWFPAMRLIWLKRHRPEIYDQISGLMMLNEYAVFRLCGARVGELGNTAETMFLDIISRQWSPEAFRIFDLKELRLNRVIDSGSVAGTLDGKLAGELGLPQVPVIMAASDTQSATIGCGDIRSGDIVVVNGSTTPLFMPIDSFMLDPQFRVYTDPYYAGRWALEGNCTQSGIIHRRLLDQLLALVRHIPGQENASRESLCGLYSGLDCGSEEVVMHWGPMVTNMSGAWRLDRLHLSATNSENNIYTSILPAFSENLAFAIHENAKQLTSITGAPGGRIILTGGGSASTRLQRALAGINTGRRILLTRELETTSRGVAIQSFIALGHFGGLDAAYAAMDTERWYEEIPFHDDSGLLSRHARWLQERI